MEFSLPRRARDDTWCREHDERVAQLLHPYLTWLPYLRLTPLYSPRNKWWPPEYYRHGFEHPGPPEGSYSSGHSSEAYRHAYVRRSLMARPYEYSPPKWLISREILEETRRYNVTKRLHFVVRNDRLGDEAEKDIHHIITRRWETESYVEDNGQSTEFSEPPTVAAEHIEGLLIPRGSRERDSGPTRWRGELDSTTTGGFAGGGVRRPSRSNPLTMAILKKPIRIAVPTGLRDAALNAVRENGHDAEITVAARNVDYVASGPTPAARTAYLEAKNPVAALGRVVHKTRSGHVQRTHNASAAKVLSNHVAHVPTTRSAPNGHTAEHSGRDLELEWADFTLFPTSLEPEAEGTVRTDSSSDGATLEHKEEEPERNQVDENSDDQSDAVEELDPWPQPDHRYTHLGPGRGKATRHLGAVNQLGFAGGGVLRPRASDVLPVLEMAGGGTAGRVMAVPDEMRIAAEREGSAARRRMAERAEREMGRGRGERLGSTPLAELVAAKGEAKQVWKAVELGHPTAPETSRFLGMSRSEVILSVALLLLAILYTLEIRQRLVV